jgi:2-hydroxy-3-keto-5-methylthiopentenyl-1-phosphate phosphatase
MTATPIEPLNDANAVRPTVGSVVIDFDGTVCAEDVSYRLFETFARPGWRAIDLEFERQAIGSRECIIRQAELLDAEDDELRRFAIERFAPVPSFEPFVAWAREAGLRLAVASDGLGSHVEPILRAAGIAGLEVFTNRVSVDNGTASFDFPHGHPICRSCGTCKMGVVLAHREHGPVAFVGDGYSDRLGALYADVVFAKDHLADYCSREGVPFLEWETFDDVRRSLDGPGGLPGPVEPARCPGWSE